MTGSFVARRSQRAGHEPSRWIATRRPPLERRRRDVRRGRSALGRAARRPAARGAAALGHRHRNRGQSAGPGPEKGDRAQDQRNDEERSDGRHQQEGGDDEPRQHQARKACRPSSGSGVAVPCLPTRVPDPATEASGGSSWFEADGGSDARDRGLAGHRNRHGGPPPPPPHLAGACGFCFTASRAIATRTSSERSMPPESRTLFHTIP